MQMTKCLHLVGAVCGSRSVCCKFVHQATVEQIVDYPVARAGVRSRVEEDMATEEQLDAPQRMLTTFGLVLAR